MGPMVVPRIILGETFVTMSCENSKKQELVIQTEQRKNISTS